MKFFSLIRNLMAIIGVIAVIGSGVGYLRWQQFLAQLDPEAPRILAEARARYVEHLDPGLVMVKSVAVDDGLTPEDVVDSLKSLAIQHNMLFVGESPFYQQVEAVTGEPYRFVSFYSFCDARVGAEMIDYHSAYAAFMPCSIALVEDQQGRLSLHMMELDAFIHGGKPLPESVRSGAMRVRDTLNQIMLGAAQGDF